MAYRKSLNNVYMLDTRMFDFPEYMSCFLIKGSSLAMIDTGMPNQTAAVLAEIKNHGFDVADITHIFITHCEHPDHAGNIAEILERAPRAKVYINPTGLKNLVDPSIQERERDRTLPAVMAARFGKTKPTARERIELVADGQVFDLGDDVRLRVRFTGAHQPSGMILFDEKNQSLFLSDLGGIFCEDCGYHLHLFPPDSNFFVEYDEMKHLAELPLRHLYLGHFGIIEDAPAHIRRVLKRMDEMLEIGHKCLAAGQKEKIAELVQEKNALEAAKLLQRAARELHDYAAREHIPPQAKNFANLFLKRFAN